MRKIKISILERSLMVIAIICMFSLMMAGCGGSSSSSSGFSIGDAPLVDTLTSSSDLESEQIPELDYEAFWAYFAQNPIEPAFNAEMETILSTQDMNDCILRYAEIWSAEIDHAYQLLFELSQGSERERYDDEFSQWMNKKDAELQARTDYYNENEATGGTIDSTNRCSIDYEFYFEKAKSVYAELFRYDNNYDYLFTGQFVPENGDASQDYGNILPDGEYTMVLYVGTGFYEFEDDAIITAGILEQYTYDDAFVRGLTVGSSIETPNGMEKVTELTWFGDTQVRISSEWTLSNGLHGWVLCYPSDATPYRVTRELDIAVPNTAEIIDCTNFEPVSMVSLQQLMYQYGVDCYVDVTIRDGYAVRVEKFFVP